MEATNNNKGIKTMTKKQLIAKIMESTTDSWNTQALNRLAKWQLITVLMVAEDNK